MLTRVSCDSCLFACVWTDDPKGFLEDACQKRNNCQARRRQQVVGTRVGSVERRISPAHQGRLIRSNGIAAR